MAQVVRHTVFKIALLITVTGGEVTICAPMPATTTAEEACALMTLWNQIAEAVQVSFPSGHSNNHRKGVRTDDSLEPEVARIWGKAECNSVSNSVGPSQSHSIATMTLWNQIAEAVQVSFPHGHSDNHRKGVRTDDSLEPGVT